MRLNEFRCYFKREVNGWEINDNWILFKKPFQLWNRETEQTVNFKNLDEALSYKIDGVTLLNHIEQFTPKARVYNGGRGSANGNKEFKFTNARGNGKDGTHPIHAAYMNTKTKERSLEGAIKAFGDRYRNADHEYGATVDNLGYTYSHVEGNATSVAIWGNKGQVVLHNHPSGGNFSKADMVSTAMSKERGVVASGKHGDYIFLKKSNFKSTDFVKAVEKARPRGKDYDDAVGKWLKANQEKYGYTYSFKRLK